MVLIRYLSRSSFRYLTIITLRARGIRVYPLRTFDTAVSPQVVLFSYLSALLIPQQDFSILFVASMMPSTSLSRLLEPVQARAGALRYSSFQNSGLHARNFPIFITTIFVQSPITKNNNRQRFFRSRQTVSGKVNLISRMVSVVFLDKISARICN